MTDIVLFTGEANPADVRLRALAFAFAGFSSVGTAIATFTGSEEEFSSFSAAGVATVSFSGYERASAPFAGHGVAIGAFVGTEEEVAVFGAHGLSFGSFIGTEQELASFSSQGVATGQWSGAVLKLNRLIDGWQYAPLRKIVDFDVEVTATSASEGRLQAVQNIDLDVRGVAAMSAIIETSVGPIQQRALNASESFLLDSAIH